MIINRDALITWAENKFDDVIVSGNEIKVNDPWWKNDESLPDRDYKLWINVTKGCFHAFKSGRTGNVIELVMLLNHCDYDEALEIVGGDDPLAQLEKRMENFLKKEEPAKPAKKQQVITLPPKTVLVNAFPDKPACRWAREYTESRHLSPDNLMVCLEGKYRERIVIPYFGPDGKLIYFNTRAISKDDPQRYLGPKQEEFGVGKGDVLWMASWPEPGTKIYLTEGEFDAMSLTQCGFHAGACGGKALCDKQIAMLAPYYIALAFDADKAGKDVYEISQALFEKGHLLMNGKPRVTLVRPPAECKDWNKFLVDFGDEYIRAWIAKYERPCTEDTLTKMRFGEL
jgi:DNA primase